MTAIITALAMQAAAVAQPALQPYQPLLGHCFSGPAPGGRGVDRHCFESVYGGQHVRDRHVVTVDGRPVYEGETLYSAKGTQVIFTYWNSLGGLGTGTAALKPDGWLFSGTIHATPESGEQPMTAEWKLVPDGYDVLGPGGTVPFKRAD